MRRWTDETMQQIMPELRAALAQSPEVCFEALDPDLSAGYAGTAVEIEGTTHLYRSLKSWMELAELLGCRMRTPKPSVCPYVRLCFRRLSDDSFHRSSAEDRAEKYGEGTPFWQIRKLEEPAFLHYYLQALENVDILKRGRILDLGVHRGDEYQAIRSLYEKASQPLPEFIGIDHSESAIAEATRRFPKECARFIQADINDLSRLSLGRFDLLISIGTLQSPGIPYKQLLMELVQQYLTPSSALILGFPNCRWIGGEMCYGAKVPNYTMSEMGHLYSDVIFAKKYLQQKKYRVTVTGKQYVFVTATKIGVG